MQRRRPSRLSFGSEGRQQGEPDANALIRSWGWIMDNRGRRASQQCVPSNYSATYPERPSRRSGRRDALFRMGADTVERAGDYRPGLFLPRSLAQGEKDNDYNTCIILKGPLHIPPAPPCVHHVRATVPVLIESLRHRSQLCRAINHRESL